MNRQSICIIFSFVWLALYLIAGEKSHLVLSGLFTAAGLVIAEIKESQSKKPNTS